jgi:MFS family permease
MLGVLSKERFTNYNIYLASSTLVAFGSGLFGPFWVVFVRQFSGSLELFAFAVGLVSVSSGIAAYFAGRLSDRIGRKTLMIIAGFALAGVVFLYTIVTSFIQLSALQILAGVFGGVAATSGVAFLGDITEQKTRGDAVGKFKAFAGIIAGVAMMIGGGYVGVLDIEGIFFIVAMFYVVSTSLLFLIKEQK